MDPWNSTTEYCQPMNNHGNRPSLHLVTVKLNAHRSARFYAAAFNACKAIHMVMQFRPNLVRKQCVVVDVEGGVAVAP